MVIWIIGWLPKESGIFGAFTRCLKMPLWNSLLPGGELLLLLGRYEKAVFLLMEDGLSRYPDTSLRAGG